MRHFTAVLDANVLHSQPLTSLLLELAVARLYRPAWSRDVHAEWRRSVMRVRPGVDPGARPTGQLAPFRPPDPIAIWLWNLAMSVTCTLISTRLAG